MHYTHKCSATCSFKHIHVQTHKYTPYPCTCTHVEYWIAICIFQIRKSWRFYLLKQVLEKLLTESHSMANKPGISTTEHYIHCWNSLPLNTYRDSITSVKKWVTLPNTGNAAFSAMSTHIEMRTFWKLIYLLRNWFCKKHPGWHSGSNCLLVS